MNGWSVVGSSFVNTLEAELISELVADEAYRDYDCAVIVPYIVRKSV